MRSRPVTRNWAWRAAAVVLLIAVLVFLLVRVLADRTPVRSEYEETAAAILGWDDACDALMTSDLVEMAGLDEAASEVRQADPQDYPEASYTGTYCTLQYETNGCTTESEGGFLPFATITVEVVPSTPEREALESYQSNLDDLSSSVFVTDSESPSIEVGSPWNDGRAYGAELFEGRKRGALALAYVDHYFVYSSIELSGIECTPSSDEMAAFLADEFLPELHASVESRLAES
jgi:hypothetical protein